jgi:triosephosphate isomerase
MHMTSREARVLVEDLLPQIQGARDRQVVLCPPYPLLFEVGRLLAPLPQAALGAQNLFWADQGAYTGEVSAPMLRDAGCRFVIVGHSERRAYFGETDETCRRKVEAALRHGLVPILCLGETLEEREAGQTRQRVVSQLGAALAGLALDSGDRLVVAYEPVWAIGTGKTDTPAEADATMGLLRAELAGLFGQRLAEQVRLLYGGSVKPDNVDGFLARPHIDGALVGGASLKADSFARIVNFLAPISR